MAIRENNTNNRNKNNNDQPKAEGWLKLRIVATSGEEFYFSNKDLPLMGDNKVQRRMLELAEQDPNKEFQLVGSIHIPKVEDDSPCTEQF